ncbi:NAD(P)-dependent alcohol dehydrogenase [Xanthovirga aplysinae]|uniref:NAD(P)-dependent alcohol dehydrogenase n=1 Tax=Xanthovirga aplysinae TaxID=2529853 RepID=UPI0012BD494F|nr:NAD(P)-dependent alcohol dehydrogenase [Xanthovirga aplysinae]MTI32654.1 NAD(P)-dependent alcohol dehydrogenase [Xanthovirga aplysinae]
MKAIVFTKYGTPDVLQLREIPKPTPKEDEVLIKVHATAVNDWDWSFIRGRPYILRLLFGLLKPKVNILGVEAAGVVERVGKNVKSFRPGDEVYGDISECGLGGFAEFVCVDENALILKPANMTFEEAAAIPHATILALQSLVDRGKIQHGQKLLINGAGGGVGTFGLQIAKLYGSEVTGVDSAGKLDMMRSIGFDLVIDYTKEDFTKNGNRYDLILDAKTTRSPFAYARSLKANGTYVTVGGHLNRLFQIFCLGPWVSLFSKKKIRILSLKPNKGLSYINELFTTGKIKCVIDGPYQLNEVPKAIQYFGEGKHKGKVVITVKQNNNT